MTKDVSPSGSSSVWQHRRGRSASVAIGDSRRQAGGISSAVAINNKRQMDTPDSQEGVSARSPVGAPPVQRVLRFSPVSTGPTSSAGSMSDNSRQLHREANHRASVRPEPGSLCSLLWSPEEGHGRAQGLLGRQEAHRFRSIQTLQDGGSAKQSETCFSRAIS